MLRVKLSYGETYMCGDVVYRRGIEHKVSNDVAEHLLTSMATETIPYFSLCEDIKKEETKKDVEKADKSATKKGSIVYKESAKVDQKTEQAVKV